MPRTKPLYIYPSSEKYKSLLDELLDIHKNIQEGSMDGIGEKVSKLVKEVDELKLSTSLTDTAITNEINNAKGVYDNINDRFLALDRYDVLKDINSLTTTRSYKYKDGLIQKEEVRGDLNFDIHYYYNNVGDVISETKFDLEGNVIGRKTYAYNSDGDIVSVSGINTDDIMILSDNVINNEHDKRLNLLESIDFVELSKSLSGLDLISMSSIVQELATQVQHLMLNLPDNIGYLIDTSEIFKRLDDIEYRLDSNKVYYTFDVNSSVITYEIPVDIAGKRFSVFIEGLLLEEGTDYEIENGNITFYIPLIDDFTVSLKD